MPTETCPICCESAVLHLLPLEWESIEDRDHPDNRWCATCIAEGEPPTDEQMLAEPSPLSPEVREALQVLGLELLYRR